MFRLSGILTSQGPGMKSQELRAQLTLFKNTLREAGVELSVGDEPHHLTREQALVVRDLEKMLEDTKETTFDDFVKSLKVLCKKEKHFRKALLLTRLRKSDISEAMGVKIEQESLFRIFLKVTCLQNEAMNILLEEITSVASESTEDTSWLHLLLNPFRYLPHIKDPRSLTTKLLDILEVASFPAQLEILDSIPEIIPDCQSSETAKQLCSLLDDKDELTGAIIDCLNALDLDTDIRSQVQDRILEKILSGTTLKTFPVILSFLMTDCKTQNLLPTLLKIRNALNTIMLSTDKNQEKESCKILIFNKLQTYTISSKAMSEAWLNMISNVKSHSDHKPIDFIILFMLHTSATVKKRLVEAVFRKRVHSGLFKINLLEKMFENYLPQQLMKDYFASIVEIGCSLVRSSNDQIVNEFASTLFHTLFNHDYTETIYCRDLLDSLIVLTGANDSKTVTNVLKILSSFLDNKQRLRQHTVLLMRLLEKLDTFELKDVKMVFDILCTLICGENADESLSGLRDEIHILVRKQLHSTKRSIKHRGIISAVVMARHIAQTSNDQDSPLPERPIKTLSDLPHGQAREAGTLLELVSTCITGCPELTGLYYDQLTTMFMMNQELNKYFMAWLHETITDDFQNLYVTETSPDAVDGISMSMQYLLNNPTEVDNTLGVNIAGLTLTNNSNILMLAAHFRIMRIVHYRQQHKDLSSINALLGCAVVMPRVDDIDDLDSDQVKHVADCLFHCANWFREIISGFVTQKSKSLRAKVMRRLQDLLDVEKQLQKCMEKAPNHKLPVSYFDSVSEVNKQNISPSKQDNRAKNPKKKFKSAPVATDADETANTSRAISQVKKKKPTTKNFVVEHPITFRDMDTDLVLLLKYPLKFPEDDVEQFSTQTATLNIDQLKFILKDFIWKVNALTQGKNIGLSHLQVVAPINLILDGVFVLPFMNSHLKVIVKRINNILETTDGRLDLPEMFTPEALDIKACFGLIIEVFSSMFSWAGFQHSSNLEVLKNLLKSLQLGQSQTLNSAHCLIIEFINYLSTYSDQCLELAHGVSLIKTMESLYSVTTPSSEVQKKIVHVAGQLLTKRWYNSKGGLDAGRNCNLNIDVLVKVYLAGANIKTICGLVGTLQAQVESLKNKEDCLPMLPSIDKQNFHMFYNGLCSALLNRVKTEVESLTNAQHLALWNTAALAMQGLMTIAKVQETKTNLVCFLKKSIGILKVFMTHGIPILEITLRSKPEEVVAIFKAMQTSTRFLHHLCCYSKLTKDSSLMAFVPKFRLTLETLVYRVKAALVANNCSAAFWMGNLRNRDLQGEDILSQSTTITEENDGNSDEELPDDDTDDNLADADVLSNNDDNRSVSSEVFD